MKIRMTALTDIGRKRDLNEDSFGMLQKEQLLLVCDGMGGHAAGDVASRVAVETVEDLLKLPQKQLGQLISGTDPSLPGAARKLVAAIRLANRRIYNLALENPSQAGMGTTVVALTFTGEGSVCIAHVGDSRAYRIRDGEIEQLTEDHSWVAELLEDKEITEEEAKGFKGKNVITRALGTNSAVKIDVRVEAANEGDSYLLCSDGLSGQVDDRLIRDTLLASGGDLNLAAERLIREANDAGGPDNVTIGILQVLQVPRRGAVEAQMTCTAEEEEGSLQEIEDRVLQKFYAGGKRRRRVLVGVPVLAAAAVVLVVAGLSYLPLGERAGSSVDEKTEYVSLEISTEPEGARIFLDGELLPGVTPLTIDSLTPGSRVRLRLQSDGYLDLTETIELPSSGLSRVFHLRPEVLVTVAPINVSGYSRAYLFIDGTNHGDLSRIANKEIPVSSGRHTFKIVQAGREIFSKQGEIPPGSVVDIVPDEFDPSLRFVITPSK